MDETKLLINKIIAWGRDKGISNVSEQILKLHEEAVEVKDALKKQKGDYAIMEELGDVFVVNTILADMLGYNPIDCMKVAYNKIEKRTGKLIDGCFVKTEDLADE